jgi:uncharacterized membrane protein
MKRAFVIFSGAMIVSLVTWIIDPETYVIFGILHLIAFASALQCIMRPLRVWNILIGSLLLIAGYVLPTVATPMPLLLPLGITSTSFTSVDYFPLIPWLGPILIGMGLGDLLYVPQRNAGLSFLDLIPWPQWLLWTGRRSLAMYFVHQPILLLLLWVLLGR